MQRGTAVPQPTYPAPSDSEHSGAAGLVTADTRGRIERIGEIVFVLALSAALLFFWQHVVIGIPVSFWGVPLDWSIMSLAQAVNIDFWARESGPRALSQAQFYQPGLWYQFASYGIYRVTSGSGSAHQLFQKVISDPQRYWDVLQVMPLALTALGTVLLWRASRGIGALARCAVISSYFVCSAALAFGVYQYFNESFTLPLAACFFPVGLRILSTEQQRPYFNALLCGVVASLLYLHKMNYIVWAIALIPAFLAAAVTGRTTWTNGLLRSLLLVAGIVVGVLALGYLLLGPTGLQMMLQSHKEILLSSGIYGQGGHTVVSLESMIASALGLVQHEYYLVLLLAACALLAVAITLLHLRDSAWLASQLPEGIFIFAAAAAMLLAVLKHYQPYYIVSVAAVLPFMIFWLARARVWIIGPVALLLTALAALGTVPALILVQKSWAETEAKMKADHEVIVSRALRPGAVRLWMYRDVDPFCGRLFLVNFTGIPSLLNDITEVQGPQRFVSPWHDMIEEASGYVNMKAVPWQAIVVDKTSVAYLNKTAHPWFDDPKVKRTELQQVVLFEREQPSE
ncbi:hypothetical protein [Tardiphaga sp. OK245]|uniref:hypothetical protein n=1 Tax=Tardiphaga sp. OK245 TaxID=1855306 RepID=UPI0008A76248|nr:hypothetical protein [Tardiphaga sp. OK245]SEI18956.1 hypothetical protein SAMN05216367_4739 [Tardiphaga sp. OK245]